MKEGILVSAIACVAGLAAGAAVAAEAGGAYPQRPVRVVVPFAPGGGTDFISRVIGQKLGETWGQTVVIDNRPGGSTSIGAAIVAKAPPDGHTLLIATAEHAIVPSILPKLPYDPVKDFTPITRIGEALLLIVGDPKFAPGTLRELLAYAKANPGKL